MLRCRLLGHRFRFSSDGATMRWSCEHGCGAGGTKVYASEQLARRYAEGLERDARPGVSPRLPPVGTAVLRLARLLRGGDRP